MKIVISRLAAGLTMLTLFVMSASGQQRLPLVYIDAETSLSSELCICEKSYIVYWDSIFAKHEHETL